ncbi:MAG: tRNA (N(6)-L-threonylcarbamoyladenosine(37)-C(2))-methylthiotransferase [Candidatus Verstraetearchaeota archaeon]|jgi:MiaB-like tRNA modifying enzyme|nr:tRNA (N(6)-L-threonylcarbamoyladenosine(37)-C(2))-methylthiotransferase [Candidatus Verstraetearchaeota archaeon]
MRIYIKTFGCSANKVEEELIKRKLISSGFSIVNSINDADVIVVNTCTVRGETDYKIMKYLSTISKTKKKIIVTGCMASAQPALIVKNFPFCSVITSISKIDEVIKNNIKICLDKEKPNEVYPHIDGIKATILIARGCLGNCSYCIVRVAKGTLKSISCDIIKNNLLEALNHGAKEIRISAQDTGVYGYDIGLNLAILLNKLIEIPGDYIMRIGMFKPSSVLPFLNQLLDSFSSEKIYKFIHMPIQSGSNKILEKMNRGYDVETFKKVLNAFRERFPNITFYTDIIVGFPGEDEYEFNETCKLIMEIKPDKTHIARFTPRPHTPAAAMPQISDYIKKKRSRELSRITKEIQLEKNIKWIGKIVEALTIEKEKNGEILARTKEYKNIIIPNCDIPLGKKIEVLIDDATPFYLIGKITKR